MDEGWIRYVPGSGKIIGIGWEKQGDDCIPIPAETAAKFITGELRKVSHRVIDRGNGPALELIQTESTLSKFWSLTSIDDEDSGVEISVDDSEIVIRIPDGFERPFLIFATVKNDPTWLVSSWDLRDLKVKDGTVTIPYPDADRCSIYMRMINET